MKPKTKYFQTSDGVNFFTENFANNHAKTLKNKTVTPVDAATVKPKKATKKGAACDGLPGSPCNATEDNPIVAAKKRKAAILKLETAAEVEKALEGETAASVIKAGADRILELNSVENTEKDSGEQNEAINPDAADASADTDTKSETAKDAGAESKNKA